MRPILIEFAPGSLRRTVFLTSLSSWALLFIVLAVSTAIALQSARRIQQKSAIDAALHRLQQQLQTQRKNQEARRVAASQAVVPEAKSEQARSAAVNSAIAQLNVPWSDVFDALEAATPPSIALLAIEPDAKKQFLKIRAEANGSQAMVAYIEALKKEPFFTSVLLSEHEINDHDLNKPLRFQLNLQFGAPSREATQ